jgi:hypothetical protein
MAWQAPIWGAGAHSAVEAKMSDSALNDNAIFASFAVERNSAIACQALSACGVRDRPLGRGQHGKKQERE